MMPNTHIFGIGTDICEVERIEQSLKRFALRFPERILGATEYALFLSRYERSQARGILFVATRFAAKEALSKALGLGMRSPMRWSLAELLPSTTTHHCGQPQWQLHGMLAQWVEARQLRLHASITDTAQWAQAMVIAEVVGTTQIAS